MYQAILIPPLKTLLPPINSVSSPTAIFAPCQRTSWRHSLSSTLRPPAKVVDSSTPPMVLLRLLKAAQSKNTRYVLHRPPRPSPVKAPPPSLLHSMELTFTPTVCSSLSNDMTSTQKPAVGTAMLSNYILCPPLIHRPLQTLLRTHLFVGYRSILSFWLISPAHGAHIRGHWQLTVALAPTSPQFLHLIFTLPGRILSNLAD